MLNFCKVDSNNRPIDSVSVGYSTGLTKKGMTKLSQCALYMYVSSLYLLLFVAWFAKLGPSLVKNLRSTVGLPLI